MNSNEEIKNNYFCAIGKLQWNTKKQKTPSTSCNYSETNAYNPLSNIPSSSTSTAKMNMFAKLLRRQMKQKASSNQGSSMCATWKI